NIETRPIMERGDVTLRKTISERNPRPRNTTDNHCSKHDTLQHGTLAPKPMMALKHARRRTGCSAGATGGPETTAECRDGSIRFTGCRCSRLLHAAPLQPSATIRASASRPLPGPYGASPPIPQWLTPNCASRGRTLRPTFSSCSKLLSAIRGRHQASLAATSSCENAPHEDGRASLGQAEIARWPHEDSGINLGVS